MRPSAHMPLRRGETRHSFAAVCLSLGLVSDIYPVFSVACRQAQHELLWRARDNTRMACCRVYLHGGFRNKAHSELRCATK